MRGEINFSATAITDMVEIREWYSEKGVAEVGQRLVRETVHRVEALKDHPELGRVVPEFEQAAIRELIVPPFRIVYRRISKEVRVVRVCGSEHLLRLLSETGVPEP